MMTWINMAVGICLTIAAVTGLGALATYIDAIDWHDFFVKSFWGAAALSVLCGAIELMGDRRGR
jgi:hypothetical protein